MQMSRLALLIIPHFSLVNERFACMLFVETSICVPPSASIFNVLHSVLMLNCAVVPDLIVFGHFAASAFPSPPPPTPHSGRDASGIELPLLIRRDRY